MPKTTKYYRCTLCDFKTKKEKNLKRHQAKKICHLRWHRCDEPGCNYSCKIKGNLKKHKAYAHDKNVTWFYCNEPECNYKCKQKYDLKKHHANKHNKNVTWFYCDEPGCNYKCKEKGHLKTHQAFKHNKNVTWFHCDEPGCNYKCKEKSNLNQHQAFKHNKNVTWFYCNEPECNYKCKHKGNLKIHYQGKHDRGDNPCEMPMCSNIVYNLFQYKGIGICRQCAKEHGLKKQRIELKYLKALKKKFDFPFTHDQRVQGDQCTRYRPDAMYLDANHKVHIQLEIDEYQHRLNNGNYSCEEKRISELYDEFKHNVPQHYVVVRLNPDAQFPGQRVDRDKVFRSRIDALAKILHQVRTNPPPELISVVYMYYDVCNHQIVKQFPTYFVDDKKKLTY